MSILEMQDEAKTRTEGIRRLEGDWKRQFEELNFITKQVGEWQERIFGLFGNPTTDRVTLKAGQVIAMQRENYLWKNVRTGAIRNILEISLGDPEWQSVPDAVVLPRIGFVGATIIQGMRVEQEECGATVRYLAELRTDENYFLKTLLPETLIIQPSDPNYTLYDFTIKIPREQLVKESLHILSEMLGRYKK